MKTLMRSLAGLTALAVLAAGLAAQDVSLGGKKAKTDRKSTRLNSSHRT